jgi:hypothetical protein
MFNLFFHREIIRVLNIINSDFREGILSEEQKSILKSKDSPTSKIEQLIFLGFQEECFMEATISNIEILKKHILYYIKLWEIALIKKKKEYTLSTMKRNRYN